MSQSTVRSSDPHAGSSPEVGRIDLLDSLAAQALTWVADRIRASHADLDGTAQDRLHDAAIGTDLRACREVVRALISDGLTAERICDVHIPEAVRRMGEEWVSGDLPFSAVTIGTARLQGLLRELDLDFVCRPDRASGSAGAILLVIPEGADHTLGPLVLASQLRRRGFLVRLALGEPPEAVAEAAASGKYDAVFLTATIARSLPGLLKTAAAIRAATAAPPPVVLGGVLVTAGGLACGGEESARLDLAAIDHVTSDLEEAMRLCGLAAAK